MRAWKKILIGAAAALAVATVVIVADDGVMFRKNISGTPEYETEFASLRMLPLYVPAQTAAGAIDADGIPYYNADGGLVDTALTARPLIGHYTDGHVEPIEDAGGFPGHGKRDAFAAVSLDDGNTWKRTNLSLSADRSSIKINRKPYPGDVLRTSLASDGNKVLVTWVSK